MSLASDLLPDIDEIRGIPGEDGVRPHSVAFLTSTWSSAHTGDGTVTTTEVPITVGGQNPKVRWLKNDEIALGNLASGSVRIGPITPAFVGGGVSSSSVLGTALGTGDTMYLKITGPKHPNGARYRVAVKDMDHAMNYMLTAEPVSETG